MKKKIYTLTSTFVFPLLQIPKSYFSCDVKTMWGSTIMDNRFIDAFLWNTSISKYNDGLHISIVLNNYRDVKFDEFNDLLQSHDSYVDNYEIENTLIYVFKMPIEYLDDLALLIDGKYSKISEGAKSVILKNTFYSGDINTIPLIFTKAKKLKESWELTLGADIGDNEVWMKINPEKETLTINKIKEISNVSTLAPSGEFEN